MGPRSEQLGVLGNGSAGVIHSLFTCPPDSTVIVKDARLTNGGNASAVAWLSVRRGSAYYHVVQNLALAAKSMLALESGFVVLQPGDEICVYSSVGGLEAIVSGALLQGA